MWILAINCTVDAHRMGRVGCRGTGVYGGISMSEFTCRLPEAVVEDTKAFRREVEKFLSGDTSAVEFRGIRVSMGIYEQRENDTYMVRIRGAAGVFLPHHIEAIAELSETYGSGIVHVTTRQDLQIHRVRIEDTPTVLERLLEVGLSTRGGGGNTVRNISACPFSAVCRDEAFDVTPYALALTEYLTRERRNFNLPRKFKVAFSGCAKDCGLASVADLGFFAHIRNGERGFAVYAGGGMGAHSTLAVLIEEFIPAGAVFEVAEAVKRLFDKLGDRANRSRARLRFVLERLGEQVFRQTYRQELELVRGEDIPFPEIRTEDLSQADSDRATTVSTRDESVWWNAVPQRQDGLYTLTVRLPLGDLPAHELLTLASIARTFGDSTIRTTQEQDLQLRGIKEADLDKACLALRKIEHALRPAQSVRCVSCTGASTCRLGLCLSGGLASELERQLSGLALSFDAVVRISGCPNACGQHPIAPLGLFGSAVRINGRLVPFYNIVAGGRVAEGNAALAQTVAKVPVKAVPALLREFWSAAEMEIKQGESLDDLMSRWGIGCLKQVALQYENVPLYEEAPDFYRDFGCRTDFSLTDRRRG